MLYDGYLYQLSLYARYIYDSNQDSRDSYPIHTSLGKQHQPEKLCRLLLCSAALNGCRATPHSRAVSPSTDSAVLWSGVAVNLTVCHTLDVPGTLVVRFLTAGVKYNTLRQWLSVPRKERRCRHSAGNRQPLRAPASGTVRSRPQSPAPPPAWECSPRAFHMHEGPFTLGKVSSGLRKRNTANSRHGEHPCS